MDQIPTVRQTNAADVVGGTPSLAYSANVVSGNPLVVMFHTRANIATPTIADTRTSTWTLRMTMGTTNTWVYVWTAPAGGSGADTVTVTQSGGTSMKLQIMELAHAIDTPDTTATGTTAISAGKTVTMPNITTTHYRTLVLDILCGNYGSAGQATSAAYSVATVINYQTTTRNTIYVQGRLSGDPGVVTGNTISTNAGALAAASQGVIAFRGASALTVSTPAIPDAVRGQTYSFQLQAVDGVGTNVWSITSGALPCGLSLSSGGVISGIPSCSNGNTITFQVQDSAATTATKNLTLQVANSANTPALIQNANSATGSVVLNGTVAGHFLILGIGATTNFGQSLLFTPLVTDNCGGTWAQLPGVVTSVIGHPYYVLMFIASGISGNCTIATQQSTADVFVSEWTNLQMIFDTGTYALLNDNTGANPIVSGSLNVPTQSEMLYAVAVPETAGATISVSAPFTSDQNFSGGTSPIRVQAAYQTGASAGANSASFPVTGNTANNSAVLLFGLRPTTTGTAPVSSPHPRAQVY